MSLVTLALLLLRLLVVHQRQLQPLAVRAAVLERQRRPFLGRDHDARKRLRNVTAHLVSAWTSHHLRGLAVLLARHTSGMLIQLWLVSQRKSKSSVLNIN